VSDQLAFDLTELVHPEYQPTMTLAERFALFHWHNPHVADALERLADQWLNRHRKVGIGALVERLRWESGITTSGEAYRINNSYRSRYARLLLDRRPEWVGRIETRALAEERSSS
jgi:hypothetical protein